MAQYVHNSWPNATTGYTPFELLFGHTPTIHVTSRATDVPAIEKRGKWLQQLRERAQAAIKNAQRILICRSGRKKGQRHYKSYARGDKVWLEATNLKVTHPTAKLAPKWYGPFIISEVISPIAFRLDLLAQWKIHNVFHMSLLLPYKEMEEHSENFPSPPPDLIEGEEEYEVERVVKSRRYGRKKELQYLLRWKGYSQAHDSWEPADQVHAPELIDEFHQRNPLAIKAMVVERESTSPTHSMSNGQVFYPPTPRSIPDDWELLPLPTDATTGPFQTAPLWDLLSPDNLTESDLPSAIASAVSMPAFSTEEVLASPATKGNRQDGSRDDTEPPIITTFDPYFEAFVNEYLLPTAVGGEAGTPRLPEALGLSIPEPTWGPDSTDGGLLFGVPDASNSGHSADQQPETADPWACMPPYPIPDAGASMAGVQGRQPASPRPAAHAAHVPAPPNPGAHRPRHRGAQTGNDQPGPEVANPRTDHPRRGRGRSAGGRPRYYCGRCNRDGVTHQYEDCPNWRKCAYCGRGHKDQNCKSPHEACTRYYCRVPPSHPRYVTTYHRTHHTRAPSPSGWDNDPDADADSWDQGEALYEHVDWESY